MTSSAHLVSDVPLEASIHSHSELDSHLLEDVPLIVKIVTNSHIQFHQELD